MALALLAQALLLLSSMTEYQVICNDGRRRWSYDALVMFLAWDRRWTARSISSAGGLAGVVMVDSLKEQLAEQCRCGAEEFVILDYSRLRSPLITAHYLDPDLVHFALLDDRDGLRHGAVVVALRRGLTRCVRLPCSPRVWFAETVRRRAPPCPDSPNDLHACAFYHDGSPTPARRERRVRATRPALRALTMGEAGVKTKGTVATQKISVILVWTRPATIVRKWISDHGITIRALSERVSQEHPAQHRKGKRLVFHDADTVPWQDAAPWSQTNAVQLILNWDTIIRPGDSVIVTDRAQWAAEGIELGAESSEEEEGQIKARRPALAPSSNYAPTGRGNSLTRDIPADEAVPAVPHIVAYEAVSPTVADDAVSPTVVPDSDGDSDGIQRHREPLPAPPVHVPARRRQAKRRRRRSTFPSSSLVPNRRKRHSTFPSSSLVPKRRKRHSTFPSSSLVPERRKRCSTFPSSSL